MQKMATLSRRVGAFVTRSTVSGGGRLNLGDEIDAGVGFVLDAHVGSLLIAGETWITIYHRGELSDEHREMVEGAIAFSNDAVDAESRVIEIL